MNSDSPESVPSRRKTRWLRFSLAGLLFFVFCWAGLWAGIRFGADRLAISPDPLQLTVVQRSAQAIPGLRGLAQIQLQDITQGQVGLSIHDDSKRPILGPLSARAGDVLPFQVKGQEFYLHVLRLDNQLVGDDRAVFEVSATDRWSTTTSTMGKPRLPATSAQRP
jgi:hypothetical protein